MTWLLGKLTGNVALWACGALLAVIAGLSTALGLARLSNAHLQAAYAQREVEIVQAQAKAEAHARQAEERAASTIADLSAQRLQEQADADVQLTALRGKLRTGTVRLRHDLACPAAGDLSGAAAAAGGTPATPAGGFTVADADAAFGIARDGDEATRLLNECIAVAKADRAVR